MNSFQYVFFLGGGNFLQFSYMLIELCVSCINTTKRVIECTNTLTGMARSLCCV